MINKNNNQSKMKKFQIKILLKLNRIKMLLLLNKKYNNYSKIKKIQFLNNKTIIKVKLLSINKKSIVILQKKMKIYKIK